MNHIKKSIFFITFLLLYQCVFAYEIKYTINFPEKKNYLEFSLSFLELANETNILIPDKWTDAYNLQDDIKFISVHVDGKSVTPNIKNNLLKINNTKNQKIDVLYRVFESKKTHPFKPLFLDKAIHFFGTTTLLFPEVDNSEKIKVTFEWNLLEEQKNYNSFGESTCQTIEEHINTLKNASYAIGNFETRTFFINNKPIHFFVLGNLFLNEKSFVFLKDIIKTQRNWFNDHDFPYYFISLVAYPSFNEQLTMVGTHVQNGFVVFSSENTNPLSLSEHFFSHELFHAWLGKKLKSSSQTEMAWFFEGFTDYFSELALLQSGYLSHKLYKNIHQMDIKEFEQSLFSDFSNEMLSELYWKIDEVESFVYLKGKLLANLWDNKIKEKSHDKYSLINPIIDMLASLEQPVTNNDIIKYLMPYLGFDVVFDIHWYIEKGELFDFISTDNRYFHLKYDTSPLKDKV